MRIRAVTVDFWGTLLLDGPASDNRYRRQRVAEFQTILGGAGVKVSPAALDRAYDASAVFLGRVWRQNRDVPVTDHVRAILDAVDPGLPARTPADVLSALVEAYARPALLVPPAVDDGARGALAELAARGLALAVVSNTMRTPGTALRRLLETYGLLGFFAHTTFSDEVGVRKPDPEIFALTLDRLGCAPEAAVHVGDDAVLDVAGARAARMRVIQVRPAPDAPPDAPRPDGIIPTLARLPEAIAALDA